MDSKYFDTILSSKGLSERPKFLWELKVTALEYARLRDYLSKRANEFGADTFKGCERECALYVAEWYRRECTGRVKYFEEIYKTLGARKDYNFKSFCKAATAVTEKSFRGFPRLTPLKVNNEWSLYTLMLQGGLPLNRKDYVVLDNLLKKDFDFEKIGLHELAQLPESGIEEFCSRVKFAVHTEKERMPIDCDNQLYERLVGIAEETEKKEREMSPFKVEFICVLDPDTDKFHLLYNFDARAKVSKEYAESHFPNSSESFSVTLKNNGRTIRKCEYYKRYYQQAESKIYPYDIYIDEANHELSGTSVEVTNDLNGEAIIADSYTFDIPHIFYKKDEVNFAVYKLADSTGRSAKNERMILAPESWALETNISPAVYKENISGYNFNVYIIPAGDERKLRLRKADFAQIDFSPETVLSWMSVVRTSYPIELCMMNVVRNLKEISCMRESELGYKRAVPENRLMFRTPYGKEWLDEPVHGKLKVTCKNAKGENLVTPEDVFFVGEGFECKCVRGRDKVRLTLTWPYGSCRPLLGKLINEEKNIWEVYKKDLEAPYDIKIQFTPGTHPFVVTLPCPFAGSYLLRPDYVTGEYVEIQEGDVIPLINFSSCLFSVVGDSAKFKMQINNKKADGTLYWDSIKTVTSSAILTDAYDEVAQKWIQGMRTNTNNTLPCPLTKLISNEELLAKLQLISSNITKSELQLSIDGKNVIVKQCPFILDCDEDGIFIRNRYNQIVDYGPELKYLPFQIENVPNVLEKATKGIIDFPSLEKVGNHYIIPLEATSENPILVYSTIPGQILPRKYPRVTNSAPKEDFLGKWVNKLMNAAIDNIEWQETLCWFEIVCNTHIPFTSIHNIEAVCMNDLLALTFLFNVYTNRKKHSGDEDFDYKLISSLVKMENEFAFSWSDKIEALVSLKQILDYESDFEDFVKSLTE